jgi:hypothetical protein
MGEYVPVSGIVVPIPNPVRILGIDETSVLFLILILGCDLRYAGRRRARVLERKQGRGESTRALLVSVRSSLHPRERCWPKHWAV